jgi:formate dehydrogenase major subunit
MTHLPNLFRGSLDATVGSGAMSNSMAQIEDTKCILIFGYNPAVSHPIVARRIIKAKEKGAKIVVCDPRIIETSRIADLNLAIKNGCNMALVNAFAHVLIDEDLYDHEFVEKHTTGFAEYKAIVAKYTPEYVEDIVGVSAEQIRQAMRIYAAAPSATILWGMGVCQWGQGVDVVKGLAGLAVLTGNLGCPNVGVGPVRGQNNVQGSCDFGALPNFFPGYQKVIDPEIRAKFAKGWGVPTLPAENGYRLTEVPHLVKEGKLKAYYIFGEDPAQSDPDLAGVREALKDMELVIVQDIFMNKTAMFADVIFPATSWGEHEGVFSSADRGLQRFHKAVEPKGDVKVDWEIISLMATAMGYPMKYKNAKEIWDEMCKLCPIYYGATYEKIDGIGSYVQWPCPTLDHPGTPYLFEGGEFMLPGGKGILFASEWRPPFEKLNDEYPLALCTVREVGHYSVRTMTGNCRALQTLADEPGFVQINSADAEKYGIKDQELIWVSSRRGRVMSRAKITDRANKGTVYMTYQWWIGACNELAVDAMDPISKTPEFKYAAAKVERTEDQRAAESLLVQNYKNLRQELSSAAH